MHTPLTWVATRESDVREYVDDFNRRVIDARRQLQGGPPVVTPTRDVEAEPNNSPLRATLIAVEKPDNPQHFANLDELFARLSAQAYSVAPAVEGSQWDGDHCTPDDHC